MKIITKKTSEVDDYNQIQVGLASPKQLRERRIALKKKAQKKRNRQSIRDFADH